MSVVRRLVTFVDLDSDHADPRRISVSARLEVGLADGRRLLLLDDRGWSSSGPPDIWATTSLEEIEFTARMVVGPDEPPPGRTHSEEAALHWTALAEILRPHGVVADGSALAQLPHDVVLSDRLLARLGPRPSSFSHISPPTNTKPPQQPGQKGNLGGEMGKRVSP